MYVCYIRRFNNKMSSDSIDISNKLFNVLLVYTEGDYYFQIAVTKKEIKLE